MNEKTPLIRLAKREDMPKSKVWLIRIMAVVVAIILGGIVLMIAGANPFAAYGEMISGSLGKASGIKQVAKIATPLLGTALALAPCFKMKYWNIGAEGQITMGAMAAIFCAPSRNTVEFTAVAPRDGCIRSSIWSTLGSYPCIL